MKKQKVLPLLSIVILFLCVFFVSAVTYNYYTQVYPQNYSFLYNGVDYANHTITYSQGNYFGMTPKNSSAGADGFYITRFNKSTILGVGTMLERQNVLLSKSTGGGAVDAIGTCVGHLPCGIMDISADVNYGYVYAFVRPTVGNFGANLVRFNNDLTGATLVPLYKGSIGSTALTIGGAGGTFNADAITISVDTYQHPEIIITYGDSVYFLNAEINGSGAIINASNTSLPSTMSQFNTYVTPEKISFYPEVTFYGTDVASTYYLVQEYVPDRDANINPSILYAVRQDDFTPSGLVGFEFDDLSHSTVDSEVFGTTTGSMETTRKINGVYYLKEISSTNFTPVTNGSATCFSGYGCYNTSSYCLTGTSQGYFCNNTVFKQLNNYIGDQCDEAHVQFCSEACVNQLVNGVYTGTCTQTDNCTNTCNINGHVQCTNTNTYATCGQYNGESCLSLGAFTGCPTGYGCILGTCLFGLTNTSVANQPIFTVTPKSYSTNVTNAGTSNYYLINYIDYTTNTVTYLTSTNIQPIQAFTISTNALASYMYRNCNYVQSTLYSNTTTITTNQTITNVFNNFNNGIINISIKPFVDGTTTNVSGTLITGLDGSTKYLFRYYLTRDINTNICLYKANSTANDSSTYWCDSTVTGDIKSINFLIQQISENGGNIKLSTRTSIVLNDGSIINHDTNWVDREDNTATKTYRVDLTTTTPYLGSNLSDNKIFYFNVFNGQDNNINWEATLNNQMQQPCNYAVYGCTIARTYVTDNTLSLFNFKDWKVCVNKVSNNGVQSGQTILENKLSPMTKMLIALGVSIGILLLCIIVGFVVKMQTDNNLWLSILGFMGVAFSVGFLVYFSIKGWLPAWIIILMALASTFVIVMLVRGLFAGKDEM